MGIKVSNYQNSCKYDSHSFHCIYRQNIFALCSTTNQIISRLVDQCSHFKLNPLLIVLVICKRNFKVSSISFFNYLNLFLILSTYTCLHKTCNSFPCVESAFVPTVVYIQKASTAAYEETELRKY